MNAHINGCQESVEWNGLITAKKLSYFIKVGLVIHIINRYKEEAKDITSYRRPYVINLSSVNIMQCYKETYVLLRPGSFT